MFRFITLLALSACAVLPASAADANRDIPQQPQTKDSRVDVTLVNKSSWFRDVKIDGREYTVLPGEMLSVKGPVGTKVYAASQFLEHRKGDTYLALSKDVDHLRVSLN